MDRSEGEGTLCCYYSSVSTMNIINIPILQLSICWSIGWTWVHVTFDKALQLGGARKDRRPGRKQVYPGKEGIDSYFGR